MKRAKTFSAQKVYSSKSQNEEVQIDSKAQSVVITQPVIEPKGEEIPEGVVMESLVDAKLLHFSRKM